MTAGRLAYMRRLLPYLEDQSEDCLYLNIYAPRQVHFKSPVYVFLHGESYEWNSGNPFDGSVLAAYNSAVFVTLNYRLGVLGFFRAGATAAANLGLLDQIAALLWIQENVAQFGGDPNSVTLIGHGTGANLASLLMVSPVARKGLFHRAVLMSGTALAPDAVVSNAELVTKQVAAQLNCPLADDEELIACLRSKDVDDLIRVQGGSIQWRENRYLYHGKFLENLFSGCFWVHLLPIRYVASSATPFCGPKCIPLNGRRSLSRCTRSHSAPSSTAS